MTTRLTVLTDFYFPATAAGGPPKGIRGALADQPELHVEVFCRNHDHLATRPFRPPYQGTVEVEGARVTYLPIRLSKELVRGLLALLAALSRADAVWLNSLHSRLFAVPWLVLLSPYKSIVMVSPRGELAPSAISSGRRRRKGQWHRLLRLLHMDRRALWISSSQRESADIRAAFPKATIFQLPERTLFTEYDLQYKKRHGELRLLFLGRICPIKGLDLGLQVLSLVTGSVRLDVVGPVEDPFHLTSLKRAADALPPNVTVSWHEPVDTADVPELIRSSDALFNPTRGENFGHAIAESLALGRPAFIGPRTPWTFAESTGAVVILDPDRPQEGARKIDSFAVQPHAEVMRRQLAAREIGITGLPGDGDLGAALHRARTLRAGRTR